MAISLSQSLQEAHRRSRGSSMGEYYHAGAGNIAVSPPYSDPFATSAPQYQESAPIAINQKQPFHDRIAFGRQNESAPPLPPRLQPQQVPSHQELPYQSPKIPIEPDPLPPHSNPQALTPSQSHAFQDSCPIPALHLSHNEIRDSRTGQPLFTLTREAAYMPAFLSSKPIVTCTRTSTNQIMGQIHFHTFTTSAIDLNIDGRKSFLAHSGVLHDRWGFQSTTSCGSSSDGGGEQMWYWSKDKGLGGAKLENAKKHGKVLARLKGDVLSCGEGVRMERENWDEVVLSAVAVVEAAWRQRKGAGIVDVSDAVGDLGGRDGGGGGGGGS